MILPMKKYSFLVYHKELDSFLADLQNLGVLHIIKTIEDNDNLKNYHTQLAQLESVVTLLNKRQKLVAAEDKKPLQLSQIVDGKAVYDQVVMLQSEYELLANQLQIFKKELLQWEPWGEFNNNDQQKLSASGFNIRFYQANIERLNEDFKSRFAVEIISQNGKIASFVVLNRTGESNYPDFEDLKLPDQSMNDIIRDKEEKEKRKTEIDELLNSYAAYAVPAVQKTLNELTDLSEFERAGLNSLPVSDNLVKVLEGWITEENEPQLQKYLSDNGLVYIAEKPEVEEYNKVPILLKNNAFSRLFEPVGKLFSLPYYGELDLTSLFAPFFMLFFGLCLGDSGYGIAMVIGATIAKMKMDKQDLKPMLTLVQLLGVSTIFGGALSGTFFGVNLAEEGSFVGENIRGLFLSSNTMFYLSMAVGFVQIIFGQIVKCFNITKQNCFSACLSTVGWIIMELSGAAMALPELKPAATITLYIGLAMAFLFSTTGNIFKRIGVGLWDMYNNVTGVFGDLLSYIRLFALGISGSILGMVVNNIGGIFLDIPYAGWLIWIVFLIAGHTGNLLLCSLGSFVHPMRLTFVEFYKNAGWSGGGKDYRPFAKKCN